MVLARRVRADGRTRALINGRTAAVADLRAIGGALLRFYAQHEHRSLTLASAQLAILDSRCGAEQPARLRACAEAHGRVRELERRLEQLQSTSLERDRELDLLEFEIAEIERSRPTLRSTRGCSPRASGCGRWTRCSPRRGRRRAPAGRGRLGRRRGRGWRRRPGRGPAGGRGERGAGAGGGGRRAARRRSPSGCGRWRWRRESSATSCRPTASGAADGRAGTADGEGPSTLEELEERLAAVERLVRKHGGSIESVHEHARAARARREQLAAARVSAGELDQQLQDAGEDLKRHVRALTRARKAAAGPFSKDVAAQLATLAMPHAGFEVVLSACEVGPSGGDAVEFLIAPNPGVPGGPVREIASGGELSRVMLAILSAAQGHEAGVTLVFDEVDAGIGGHTARAVGSRLRELARECQVICITHLPQIASLAERHFSIVKQAGPSETRTEVQRARLGGGRGGAGEDARGRGGAGRSPPPRRGADARGLNTGPERSARVIAGVTLAVDGSQAIHTPRAAGVPPGPPSWARSRGSPGSSRGPVRPGRRTKLLVRHLVRGDIALVDHLDIDRVSAEELIAAGAVAVLNCSPSSGAPIRTSVPSCWWRPGCCSWTSPTTGCSRRSATDSR